MAQTAGTAHDGHRSGGRTSFSDGAVRAVTGIAEVTTSSIGALGGAAVGSLVGGVRGAVSGVAEGTRRGLEQGSHSTPAAIATMAAAGAIGVVEWPVVLTVGGAALVLRQLHERGTSPKSTAAKVSPKKTAPKKAVSKKAVSKRTEKKSPAKKTTASRPQGRTTR
ncbi:hypothetical protein [Prescottella sp. R16]|uniref:hypothetical protein n=1 Tax=Prescottella sp. R16 TaxID=3064529 RepID=UPI00272DE46D|nr:hypothetical protein [Prescottella sp. R16]